MVDIDEYGRLIYIIVINLILSMVFSLYMFYIYSRSINIYDILNIHYNNICIILIV